MEGAGINTGLWEPEEHERYLAALNPFVSWEDVARRVGTRSRLQCRTHHQKIEKKLRKAKEKGLRKSVTPRVEHRLPAEHEMLTLSVRSKMCIASDPTHMKQPISPSGVDEKTPSVMLTLPTADVPTVDSVANEAMFDDFTLSVDDLFVGFDEAQVLETIPPFA